MDLCTAKGICNVTAFTDITNQDTAQKVNNVCRLYLSPTQLQRSLPKTTTQNAGKMWSLFGVVFIQKWFLIHKKKHIRFRTTGCYSKAVAIWRGVITILGGTTAVNFAIRKDIFNTKATVQI